MQTTNDRLLELEARVAQLEDERQLRELLARYSIGADLLRDPRWVKLFTEDGSYDFGPPHPTIAGHAELLEFIRGSRMPSAYQSQHWHGQAVFKIDGDRAAGLSYSITFEFGGDPHQVIFAAGMSLWRFRRVGRSWRIQQRIRRDMGRENLLRFDDGSDLLDELLSIP